MICITLKQINKLPVFLGEKATGMLSLVNKEEQGRRLSSLLCSWKRVLTFWKAYAVGETQPPRARAAIPGLRLKETDQLLLSPSWNSVDRKWSILVCFLLFFFFSWNFVLCANVDQSWKQLLSLMLQYKANLPHFLLLDTLYKSNTRPKCSWREVRSFTLLSVIITCTIVQL